eukprot:g7937.t1
MCEAAHLSRSSLSEVWRHRKCHQEKRCHCAANGDGELEIYQLRYLVSLRICIRSRLMMLGPTFHQRHNQQTPMMVIMALLSGRLVPSSLIQQLDGVLTMHWDLVEAGSQGQGREDVERSQKKGSFGPRALKGLRVPKGSF